MSGVQELYSEEYLVRLRPILVFDQTVTYLKKMQVMMARSILRSEPTTCCPLLDFRHYVIKLPTWKLAGAGLQDLMIPDHGTVELEMISLML